MKRIWVSRVAALVALVLSLVTLAQSVRAASVEPIFKPDNPTCQDLGYDLGLKVDPVVSGEHTYLIDGAYALTVIVDDGLELIEEWTSEIGIDAVIVKGGSDAILWAYDPPAESTGDTALVAPTNPNTGLPYAISHAEFCYDYALNLSKTVQAVRTMQYRWDIDKSVEPDQMQLPAGATEMANYVVTLSGAVEETYAVYGTISISSPYTVTISGVSDVVAPDIVASVECEENLPYKLPAWSTLECTYHASVPSDAPGSNTATVTTQGGVAGSQVTTDFAFNGEVVEVDVCVIVSDSSPEGPQETTVCAEELPWEHAYSQQIGPYACGTYEVENTVSYLAQDTGAAGEDTTIVQVSVPCGLTRPRSSGYWKNHSEYGPAPYDPGWAVVGASTEFFDTGMSYYDVLRSQGAGGNVYYVLAEQYIAAQINWLNGLPISDETLQAFAQAEDLFEAYLPDETLNRKNKATKDLQDEFLAVAKVLKTYNHP